MNNFKDKNYVWDNKKPTAQMLGRWQPWHEGHRWLIDQRLNEGKNVLICIRDVEPNENQPWTSDEVMLNLTEELKDLLNEGRIKIIKKVIDQMFVILPFEKKYYQKLNYEVNYVGHPLLDVLKNRGKLNDKREKIIALLPGSRDQEISKILPLMLSVTQEFKDYKFVICGAPSKTKLFYEDYIKKTNSDNIEIVQNQTYEVLKKSCAALVTSGTATLEAALFKTPQVVCYKSSWISFQIGKILLKNLKFISLVNLILDKTAVTELIQGQLNKRNIAKELKYIISEDGKKEVLEFYNDLEKLLSKDGASKETASKIVNYHLEPNS